MLAYRDGDAAAFEVLYARHRGRLFRYLLHQCARREQADEMFQEVWMSVIRARSGYEVSAKFTTWLFRIAHNRLIDGYRARGRLAAFADSRSSFTSARWLPETWSPQSRHCLHPSAKPFCWLPRAV